MPGIMLTLHYPKGLRGMPIATSTDPRVLRFFKRVVLEEWQHRIENSSDEGEAILDRLEYQRLKTALSIFISENEADDEV